MATDPSEKLAVEASGSTIYHDGDAVVEVCGDEADQSGHESDSSSYSLESAADSGPKSATGDCLTCSETKEVAIKSACKMFKKKVWASCSIAKDCLWPETLLKWIGDSHQAV